MDTPLTADDFVHWHSADPSGARGTLGGADVALTGPMGTAFYLHDDYAGFATNAYSPPLAATGMVELTGGADHRFSLTLTSPVSDPVLHLGSFGSRLTFPESFAVAKLSGDSGLTIDASAVVGTPAGPTGEPATDSAGTVALTGTFTAIDFTLLYTGPGGGDGVFLQFGGHVRPPS